jgi:hypothetical protein
MTKNEIVSMLTKILESMGVDGWIVDLKSKKKRSKDANAYSWVLQDKIANELRESKDDVHVQMLTDFGQTATDDDGNKILFSIESRINPRNFYKYIAVIGYGKVGDKEFTHYRALKGSSDFDQYEMSVFLKGVIQTAQDLGIDTITPDEREKMIQLWGAERAKKWQTEE